MFEWMSPFQQGTTRGQKHEHPAAKASQGPACKIRINMDIAVDMDITPDTGTQGQKGTQAQAGKWTQTRTETKT